jgi:hypothetical protein
MASSLRTNQIVVSRDSDDDGHEPILQYVSRDILQYKKMIQVLREGTEHWQCLTNRRLAAISGRERVGAAVELQRITKAQLIHFRRRVPSYDDNSNGGGLGASITSTSSPELLDMGRLSKWSRCSQLSRF